MRKKNIIVRTKSIFSRLVVAFLIVGMLATTTSVQAGAKQWFTHDSQSEVEIPEVALVSASADTIELQAIFPELRFGETTISGQHYLTLNGEGYLMVGQVGAPELPVVRQLVEVPLGAGVSLQLLQSTTKSVNLAELGLQGQIAPNSALTAKMW